MRVMCVCTFGSEVVLCSEGLQKVWIFLKNRLVWYEGGFLKMRTNFTVKKGHILKSGSFWIGEVEV